MFAFLKKIRPNDLISLFAFSFLFFSFSTHAQIIFLEDFENGMPGNFTLVDQDGQTPASQVSFMTNAWVVRIENGDSVAVSTSFYDPAGVSDDWMITSVIHIDSPSVLTWNAKAQDADFPDGYQVRISTTDTSRAAFLAHTSLFNTNRENPVWTARSVNLAAAGYANQDVYIAFRNTSNDQFLLKVDDIMVRNPSPTDAKAISLTVPNSSCQLTNAENISVTIENYGITPLSNLHVTYIVDDGNTPVTVTETLSNSIAALTSYNYTFTQKADLSTSGTIYNISAYVSAAGDADLTNDSLDAVAVVNVQSHDASSPYTTSFETVGEVLGWTVQDDNNDGNSWGLASGDANTGDNLFVYQYSSTDSAYDWLFSTCLDLKADTLYELKFFYKVGTGYPERLKVAIGTSPNGTSMATVIKDLGELTNDSYQEFDTVFTVPSINTYYVGFLCYSDTDEYFLAIDDVTVQELQPPVASFTTGKNKLVVTFSSTSKDADSLYWDFGDGATSSTSPVVHTYASSGSYIVCLTAFNTVGSDTYCDTIDITTGVALIDESMFSIFPNPAKDVVIIDVKENLIGQSDITISDMVGKKIIRQPVQTARTTFDLSEKPDGIYFITLQAGESSARRKVILVK